MESIEFDFSGKSLGLFQGWILPGQKLLTRKRSGDNYLFLFYIGVRVRIGV